MEKLLQDALIKVSTVATDIFGVPGRAMIEALIAGEQDPRVLAELAKGRMRSKRAALAAALDGHFDDHHAELAQMILDQVDVLTRQIDRLTTRIEDLIAAIPAAQAPARTTPAPSATTATTPAQGPMPRWTRRGPWPRSTGWTRSPGSDGTPPRSSSPRWGWI